MNHLMSLVYGAIQGLTEFLPVSSSGHLALLPKLMEVTDPGIAFDLMLHLATALAIILYFHKTIFNVLKSLPWVFSSRNEPTINFCRNLIIATIGTGIPAVLLKDFAEEHGRNLTFICINLIVFGVLMYLFDAKCSVDEYDRMKEKVQWKEALAIGFFQTLAIFPGVSRSGITLTVARALKMSRRDGAEFSFLLSLPLILGGVILKIPKYQQIFETTDSWPYWVSGFVFAFLFGILTIHFFLKVISQLGLGVFTIYRILTAIVILLVY